MNPGWCLQWSGFFNVINLSKQFIQWPSLRGESAAVLILYLKKKNIIYQMDRFNLIYLFSYPGVLSKAYIAHVIYADNEQKVWNTSSDCFTPIVLFTVKAAMLIGWQDHRIPTPMMLGLNWPRVFRGEDLQTILC